MRASNSQVLPKVMTITEGCHTTLETPPGPENETTL